MTNKLYLLKTTSFMIMILGSLMLTTNVSAQDPVIVIDGTIGTDEYTFNAVAKFNVFTLYWEAIGDEIYFGIWARTTGYVGINVDPGEILNDADLLYGWVDGNDVEMADTYSDSPFGPPKLDTSDGGTDDILEFAGKEDNGVTIFEFRRKLVTTDNSHDNKIDLNGTVIGWTTGDSDDFTDRPDENARVNINFETGETEDVKDNTIYYIIGGVVVVVLLVAITLFWYIKKRRSAVPSE